MKTLLGIFILIFITQSCNTQFEIDHEKTVKPEAHLHNSENTYVGNIIISMYQNSNVLLSNISDGDILLSFLGEFRFKKISLQRDSIWVLQNISFVDSRVGGCFYLFHSPPSISYFKTKDEISSILEFDFQLARCINKSVAIQEIDLNYNLIIDSIQKWHQLPIEEQSDTLTFSFDEIDYGFDTIVKLKKRYKFKNTPNGLIIKEIDSFPKKKLADLQLIFGNGKMKLNELVNLVDTLDHPSIYQIPE